MIIYERKALLRERKKIRFSLRDIFTSVNLQVAAGPDASSTKFPRDWPPLILGRRSDIETQQQMRNLFGNVSPKIGK